MINKIHKIDIDIEFLSKATKYLKEKCKENYNWEYIPRIVDRILFNNFGIKTTIYQGEIVIKYNDTVVLYPHVFNVYKGKVIDLGLSFKMNQLTNVEREKEELAYVRELPDFYYEKEMTINIPGIEKFYYTKKYKRKDNQFQPISYPDIDNIDPMALALYDNSYVQSMIMEIRKLQIDEIPYINK